MLNNEIKNFSKLALSSNIFLNYFQLFNYSISIDEALKILGLKKDNLTPANLKKKYDYLISKNNPYKSGSFYLQCKVFNAKEKLLSTCQKQNKNNSSFLNIKVDNDLYKYKKSKIHNHL